MPGRTHPGGFVKYLKKHTGLSVMGIGIYPLRSEIALRCKSMKYAFGV